MSELQERLRARGSSGVHLGVSARNQQALGFYAHLGYTELHADEMGHTLGLAL